MQVREKVALLVKGPVICEVALVPDQPSEAVHAVAFLELQEIVVEVPAVTEVGFAAIATVGATDVGVVPLTLLIWYTRIIGAQLLSWHTAETKSL